MTICPAVERLVRNKLDYWTLINYGIFRSSKRNGSRHIIVSLKKWGEIYIAVSSTAVGFSSKDKFNSRDKFPANYRLA